MVNQHTLKDSISLANLSDIPKILKAFRANNEVTIYKLQKEFGMSNDKVSNLRYGAINMKLLEQNTGLHLTELGNKILDYYENNKVISNELMKEASLNVYVFKLAYEKLNEEIDPDKAHLVMYEIVKEIEPKIDCNLLGSITKKYLWGVHAIRIPNSYRWKDKLGEVNSEGKNVKTNKTTNINSALLFFVNHFNMSTKQIDDFIAMFDSNKQEELKEVIYNCMRNK